MKEIVFFSNNSNKISEICNFLSDSNIKILSLNDCIKIKSPKETGFTFKENAKIKSLYGYKKFNKICFADDSGICIKALKEKPGVNSKEFLNLKNKPEEVLKEIISVVKKKKFMKLIFKQHYVLL